MCREHNFDPLLRSCLSLLIFRISLTLFLGFRVDSFNVFVSLVSIFEKDVAPFPRLHLAVLSASNLFVVVSQFIYNLDIMYIRNLQDLS